MQNEWILNQLWNKIPLKATFIHLILLTLISSDIPYSSLGASVTLTVIDFNVIFPIHVNNRKEHVLHHKTCCAHNK